MRKKHYLAALALALMLFGINAKGNDSSYYVSGNQLVPVDEKNIAVAKEVLTIEIGDDGYAYVDVDYVFRNNGPAKSVTMGFEALLPYNEGSASINPKGIHPYIKNFTVEVNAVSIPYSTGIVAAGKSMKPLDMKKWRYHNDDDGGNNASGEWNLDSGFLSNGKDTLREVSCAYYFKAHFKHGLNEVHHTYRYQMGSSVVNRYDLEYKLSPALRWANHQIDDFTLRIGSKKGIKHFWISDKLFRPAPFKVISGKGKVRRMKANPDKYVHFDYTEVALRYGMVEWKAKNFRPKSELFVTSPMTVHYGIGVTYDTYGFFDMGDLDFKAVFGREENDDNEYNAFVSRVLRNMPYAGRGYVFRDEHLKKFFNSQWWYMPDPSWKMSASDFSAHDNELINNNK